MKERIVSILAQSGVPHRLVEHVAVYHVGDEAPELAGLPSAKNLLLKDRSSGQVYMVVMEGEKRLDIAALASQLGSTKNRLQFIKYDDVEAAVGVPPGHVSIFNVLNTAAKDVQIVFDNALMQYIEIGFHPNVNTATIFMHPDDVVAFLTRQGFAPLMVTL